MDLQNPSDSVDQNATGAQIGQCYRQLPISLAVNLAVGMFLVVVLWGVADTRKLFVWIFFLLTVTDARFLTWRAFLDAPRNEQLNHDTWRRYFVNGACAAGIVWGAAGMLLFNPESLPHQVFLAFVVGGMVAGGVPLLSSVKHAYACFTVPAVLPIGTQMLAAGDRIHLTMGLMIATFAVAMLVSSAQVRRLIRESANLRHQLNSSIEAGETLEQLVRQDALTEIPNRRRFEETFDKEWRRAGRETDTISVITADIDHFKEYNDHYGHLAGDRCLVKVAQTMQSALSRPGDVVARIGGEEFAFLLPGTTPDGAKSLAEMIRRRVLDLNIPHEASPTASQVTVSFGIASSDLVVATMPAELLQASDIALYDAKRRGRNRVAVAETSVREKLKKIPERPK